MKLFRNELVDGISHKQYEFPVNSLTIKGINIVRDKMYCNITSEVIPNGFKIDGVLTFYLMNSCDRCLEQFEEKYNPKFELLLTSNIDLIKKNNLDIIHFPESMTEIDLVYTFDEFILLEKPIKFLCKKECKGLCQYCGVNLNLSACDCRNLSKDNTFNILQNFVK